MIKNKLQIIMTIGWIFLISIFMAIAVYALTTTKELKFFAGIKYDPTIIVDVYINDNLVFSSRAPGEVNQDYIDNIVNDTINFNSNIIAGETYNIRIVNCDTQKDILYTINNNGELSGVIEKNNGTNSNEATEVITITETGLGQTLFSIKLEILYDLKDLDKNDETGLNFGEAGTIKHDNIKGKTFYVSDINGLLKLSALVGKVNTTTTVYDSKYDSDYGYDNSSEEKKAITFEGATIQMLDNIDCENGEDKNNFSKKFIPIGNETNSFKGTFDGNNKTITGLYIYQETDNAGLFGYVSNAEIKDLTIQNGKVISGTKLLNTNQTSSLTEMFSCFSNVKKRGLKMQTYKPVSIPSYRVGNFVAYADNSLISHCSAEETEVINSTGRVGGIVGVSAGATITNCLNMGNVYGSAAGGIVGGSTSEGLIIINCSNTGNIIEFYTSSGSVAPRTELGGIVGLVNGTATIINSYNFGSVGFGRLGCGGIVGYVDAEMAKIIIRNCYNTADIEGSGLSASGAGGIVGCAYKAKTVILNNCYNSGLIEGLAIGGIVGSSQQGTTVTITNCYNIGNVSGSGPSGVGGGGIVGIVNGTTTTITNCYYLKTDSVNASLDAIDSGTATEGSYYGTFEEDQEVVIEDGRSLPTELGSSLNLKDLLNAWVDINKDTNPNLKNWKEDKENINDGYPVFA